MSDPNAIKRNLLRDVDVFEYRVASIMDREHRAVEIKMAKEHSRKLGLLEWKPLKLPRPPERYARESYLIYKADRSNHRICWDLQAQMATRKESILSCCNEVIEAMKESKKFRKWGNISPSERSALRSLKKLNLYFSLADKNLGPVISSPDLVKKQLALHLQDEAGTFREVHDCSTFDIIDKGIEELEFLSRLFKDDGFASHVDRFIHYAKWCRDKGKLCSVFILWKLHKKPKDNGLESRLIAPNIDYFTADASTFLHAQLAPSVFSHDYVLQDSLSLCRMIEKINLNHLDWSSTNVVSSDVVALYPSIDLKDGMEALKWFLENFTPFSEKLRFFIASLAEFVLNHNFVEADGIGSGIFQQVIGVAMGTSFSVVFAIIFMIWLETPIIEKYQECILLFKRQIDDMLFIWQGPEVQFENMKREFNCAHPNIRFDWGSLSKAVSFLDLNLLLTVHTNGHLFIKTSVYCKPGNAFCYIQPDSFHPSHIPSGWIKTLLIRNITRTNTVEDWRSENLMLFQRLRARGHSHKFLLKMFDKIYWEDRGCFLSHKPKQKNVTNRVVLSTQYVPGFDFLRKIVHLNFDSFRTCSVTRKFFPSNGSWVAKAPPRLRDALAAKKAKRKATDD